MTLAKQAFYLLGLPIVLILVWWFFTATQPSIFFPTPGAIAEAFVHTWTPERFVSDVLPSIYRLLFALLLSIVIGFLLGIVIGTWEWVREFVEPLLEFIRAIPSTILIPVFLLLIGINDTMKITVIFLGCLWPILLNTVDGVRAVDGVLRETTQVYRVRGFLLLRAVIIPNATPQLMAGIRQSIAVGMILMVISEMFAAVDGLGFTIIQLQSTFAIPALWSGVLILGLIGVVLSAVFHFIERRVLSWYFGLKEVVN